MSTIEEKLWNYIDGNCTPEEEQAISRLIAEDEVYRKMYEELLSFNAEIQAIELDEPRMAFTYNVMETIRTEEAQKPLKAAINKKIIWGIAAFFVITILGLLIAALASVNWSAAETTNSNVLSNIKVPDLRPYLSGPIFKGFLFFDVIMGLYLFDSYLRKKKLSEQL